MLRNLGIRSKILAVLALPVVVLVLAATIIAGTAFSDARSARQIEELSAQAPGLSQLIRGVQAERALTARVLAGDSSAQGDLGAVRAEVSKGLASVREAVGGVNLELLDDGAVEAVAGLTAAHDDIERLRQQVDANALLGTLAYDRYSTIIAAEVALAGQIAAVVPDPDLASMLRTFSATEHVHELVVQERDMVLPAVAAGEFSPLVRDQVANLVSRQEAMRQQTQEQAQLVDIQVPVTSYEWQLARQKTVEDPDGVLGNITVDEYLSASQSEFGALTAIVGTLAKQAGERSAALSSEAASRALQIAVAAVLLVLLPLVLALFIARGITRPLRRLTEAAAEIRTQLPQMVERMQTPGEGPGLTLPDIPVESGDEIGRLASAFNDVNQTTVQVAQEQAALRGSIAAMFVNVARRDQVLLSRQLAFIDHLERQEEDPDTLEDLFKLDHLATRMRRNAESLLVLAGIDTGRRLRREMPLSDVIRTASSEIEHYERIDLALRVDPPMVGHLALSTAHLLAELLENATRFSDPGSRVVVATGSNARGVLVTVTDEGLGMSPEEIADANSRIADPPVSEVVGAQRLGFFVVGRLARKLDASVSIRAGRSSGTIVEIELPPALFVPGSVVEVPGADEQVSAGGDQSTSRIALPDTADAALSGQVEDAADGAEPLPEVTDAGLPRRGQGRVRPTVVQPPASLPAPPAAPPVVAEPSTVDGTTAAGLPRRARGVASAAAASLDQSAPAVTAPVLPESIPDVDTRVTPDAPASVESPAPGPGLFSAFRARRAELGDPGDKPAPALADAAPVDAPLLEAPSMDAPSLDALSVEVEPAEPLPSQPVAPEEPAATHEPATDEPLAAAALDAPAVPLADSPTVPLATPLAEPVESPAVEAVATASPEQPVDPASVDVPLIGDRPTHRFAATELTRLATTPAATTAGEPAEPPVDQPGSSTDVQSPAAQALPAQPAPAPPFGAPAVTILPGSGRGRSLRRGRKGKSEAPAPVQPMTRRELRRLEQGPGTLAPGGAPSAPYTPSVPIVPAATFGGPSATAPEGGPAATVVPGVPARPRVPLQGGPVDGHAPSGLSTRPTEPTSEADAPTTSGPVLPPPSLFGNTPQPTATPTPTGAADPTQPVAVPIADTLRQRSALASEALAELSMLSSYSPSSVDTKPPSTLTRRTPAATPAAQVSTPKPVSGPARRARTASDVRSMLSGFQAGVARGRTSPNGSGDVAPAEDAAPAPTD